MASVSAFHECDATSHKINSEMTSLHEQQISNGSVLYWGL